MSVVLPESMWAEMPMFRTLRRFSIVGRSVVPQRVERPLAWATNHATERLVNPVKFNP